MRKMLHFLLYIVLYENFLCVESEDKMNDFIPPEYNYIIPPKINNEPVIVNVTFRELNVISVDEEDQTFTVSAFLRVTWFDPRVLYPYWGNGRYQPMDVKWLHMIWNPHLSFINAVNGKTDDVIKANQVLGMHPYKMLSYHSKVVVKLRCEMDLHQYPHDHQECNIWIASAVYNHFDLKLNWVVNQRWSGEAATGLQQYQIVDSVSRRCYNLKLNLFDCLEYTIRLRRRYGYHIINIYIPTVLIVLMSMMTFWIPHDAVPARITLGVTSLLTIITKQYQASMPNVSYVVALNVWLSCCVGFVFLTLLEYAIVITWFSKMPKDHFLFKSKKGLVLPIIIDKNPETLKKQREISSSNSIRVTQAKRLDCISRILFPILFVMFCLIYWRCYVA